MATKYLQLEFKTGLFYEYSADEKDGFVKHKYKDKKGNKKISYRKYYEKGIKGKLDSVSIYTNEKMNNTKFVSLSLRDKEGDLIFVPVQIYDSRNDVATYAESLISLLPNLNKGDKIKIYGYNFTPKNEKYPRIGIGIEKKGGDKVERAFTYEYTDKDGKHHKGDIPAIEWKEKKDKLTKETKNVRVRKTVEAKNDFLIDALAKEIDRLKFVKEEDEDKKDKKKKKDKKSKSEDKEEKTSKKDKKNKKEKSSKKSKKKEKVLTEEEEDDMPF